MKENQMKTLAIAAVAVTMVLISVPQVSADVIITTWWTSFGFPNDTTNSTSASKAFTDPVTGETATMTVAVVSGTSINFATHLGINGGTGTNVDAGEAVSFTWDKPVKLTQLVLFQGGTTEELILSSSAFTTYVSLGNTVTGPSVTIPANTAVVLTGGNGTNGGTTSSYRFDGATFQIPLPIPEPASLALAAMGGVLIASRRRK